ncbi:MAG: Deoxycytidine triphosphate deaminase [candidate division WS6 bacterium GW2011_GWF1_35_23]|uniref:dCTP deaminase, dUMP-forming n=1 Tax=candidate division WS6 bacterium GW2011_GWF1_35_23 TaxID=1619097 RepID=A0A0G0FDU5_9BACT|nr:MAG: Deoxycytidine triphosphate deaminase [candidate division WS6 bacterium GW2011_GWF1_35_23]
MILSDKTIKEKVKTGEIFIEPFEEKCLQSASYDLHLDKDFLVFNRENHSLIDVKEPVDELMKKIVVEEDKGIIIHPGDFVLANVKEITGVDEKHVGRLEGKSSLARMGLIIHTTAGFLDPGNKLRLTLEMVNLSPLPIKLYPGMKIGQIAFEELDQKCERPYGTKGLGNKYVGDMTVTASQMWKNFNEEENE